jgi:RIO kinase 1
VKFLDTDFNLIELNEKTNKKKTSDLRRIFAEVFDKRTLDALNKLIRKKDFDKIDKIISTGKEGNVFKGIRGEDNCAVKIYRIETSNFDNMMKYISGDPRFKRIKKNKQSIIYEWTKKEYKNLSLASNANVNVPYPIDFYKNVLVMQLLGHDEAELTLKDTINTTKIQDNLGDILEQTISNLHKFVYDAKLVHADLSEYNMMYFDDKLYFIDVGQSVTLSHPLAEEFYIRDLRNIVKLFNNYDFNLNVEDLRKRIKNY